MRYLAAYVFLYYPFYNTYNLLIYTIVHYIDYLLCSNFLIKENTELEQIDIEYDTNTGINKLFNVLDERSILIIKKYTGYDSHRFLVYRYF